MKQTILVTGASSGIGLFIAQRLHESGHQVIGTSRHPQKHQIKSPFKLLSLDIGDETSVTSFTKRLFTEIDHLDVLINNAGFMITGLAEETSVELGKQQFDINFWGTIKLTKELLPHFRKRGSGKIITTGSFLGLIGHPGVSYYSASKHALEGYFKSLRFELNQFDIKVSMIEPMYNKSNITDNSIKGFDQLSEYTKFRTAIEAFYDKELSNAPLPLKVSETVEKIVNEKNPKFSYPIGRGASLVLTLQRLAYNSFEKSILKRMN